MNFKVYRDLTTNGKEGQVEFVKLKDVDLAVQSLKEKIRNRKFVEVHSRNIALWNVYLEDVLSLIDEEF